MPRKLRELRRDLRRAGYYIARQRGSHENWKHDLVPEVRVVLTGKDSVDAKVYQEDEVQEALRLLRKAEEKRRS